MNSEKREASNEKKEPELPWVDHPLDPKDVEGRIFRTPPKAKAMYVSITSKPLLVHFEEMDNALVHVEKHYLFDVSVECGDGIEEVEFIFKLSGNSGVHVPFTKQSNGLWTFDLFTKENPLLLIMGLNMTMQIHLVGDLRHDDTAFRWKLGNMQHREDIEPILKNNRNGFYRSYGDAYRILYKKNMFMIQKKEEEKQE